VVQVHLLVEVALQVEVDFLQVAVQVVLVVIAVA
jgi:hypothetical protein